MLLCWPEEEWRLLLLQEKERYLKKQKAFTSRSQEKEKSARSHSISWQSEENDQFLSTT